MNSFELTLSITTLATAISQNLTPTEIAMIAGILVQLGDTLATISIEKTLREECEKIQDHTINSSKKSENAYTPPRLQ